MFSRPKKLIRSSGSEPPPLGYVGLHALAEATCRYDLCELDMAWLEIANEEFREMGKRCPLDNGCVNSHCCRGGGQNNGTV